MAAVRIDDVCGMRVRFEERGHKKYQRLHSFFQGLTSKLFSSSKFSRIRALVWTFLHLFQNVEHNQVLVELKQTIVT